jgi:carboxypeptidase C (cathepsin A)
MIGLFQENGPCRINNQSTGVNLNPESWNDVANVYVYITVSPFSSRIIEYHTRLYIDQPVGAGFSYGAESVGTSEQAAVDVWEFLQIWFADSRFHKYASRDFGLWTESYGGHYGPTFAAYAPRCDCIFTVNMERL